ncbi:MAG: hypothetical protein Q4Q20_05570 [Methanocorpusculum sp.]|nr:hypothetical protein [Methanocorpusculum sp.]
MKKSGKPLVILIPLAAMLVLAIVSAGCIDEISPLPDEVKIKGNVISVDSSLMPSDVIMNLLFSPNEYEKEAFEAVEKYVPPDDPVVEVGVGPGTLAAYINQHLRIKTDHIAFESNPYLLPLLEKTKATNQLGTRFINGAVAYGSDTVPVSITKNFLESNISPTRSEETVDVPAHTLRKTVAESDFLDKTCVTVVVEINDVWKDILTNEPDLADFVSTFIVATWNISQDDREILLKKTRNAGFSSTYVSDTGKNGLEVFVFTRDDSLSENGITEEIPSSDSSSSSGSSSSSPESVSR